MNELQPVLDLLSGNGKTLLVLIAWIGALRVLAKPISAGLQYLMSKLLAFVQGTPQTDDDAWVEKILASIPYRAIAFLVDLLASIKLPNSASMQKAVEKKMDAANGITMLLIGALALGLCGGMTGCMATGDKPTVKPTAMALAYYTLADTKIAVDGAEKVYGRACALNQITVANQVKVDDAINKFHASFKLAVRAARADFTAITPAEVQLLADGLLALIQQFTPATK